MKFNHQLICVLGALVASVATVAYGKLPAPAPMTDEQKAKAAEAKEKAAEAAKKDAADLGRYQDRAANRYFADAKAAGKVVPASTWVPPAPAPAPAAAAQTSSSPAPDQKQGAAQKTQNGATPAAAKKTGADAKPAPVKG